MEEKLTAVRERVVELLGQDKSGHGMEHIDNVVWLAEKFAKQEGANVYETKLTALLHEVDDHKIVGEENAKKLLNARKILADLRIENDVQERVLQSVATMGYSNRLIDVSPDSLEGKIVSDADMCEGLGTNGILRTHAYGLKHGRAFFDRNIFPIENITAEEYAKGHSTTSINHFFEKILRLKDLMLTNAGRAEAEKLNRTSIDFLYKFFEENHAPEWIEYLDNYLKQAD